MNVNPGELNKRIQIIRFTESRNANGFPTGKTGTVVRTCWAKFSTRSGTEILRSGSEISEAKQRFLVRDNGVEIVPHMVVRYGGEDYNIVYVNTYGDNREYLEIWTETSERTGTVRQGV